MTTDTTGPRNYKDLANRIYFSFWSWNLLKDCPQSFYLRVLCKSDGPKTESKHNAIQGSIPGTQSEVFFRLPIHEREMGFFIDTFDFYWNDFIKNNKVDFAAFALQHIKSEKLDITNTDPVFLHDFGYKIKLDETREHCHNLMKMISSLGLHRAHTETEVPFNVTLEPAREEPGMRTPELAIGGRIDLVVSLGNNNEEVWDVKAVKKPNSLDPDQLLMYKMGRQAMGKVVVRTGYLHAKQGRAEAKKFLPVHEDELRKMMRQSMFYFNNNQWPTNFRKWRCGYCDVRTDCPAWKDKERHDAALSQLKSGKVEF